MHVVTTQSAGGAIHTKFCSSSDSEPDELPSSAVTAAHRESTGTVTSPLSKQPPPSGVSKGRRNREAEEPLRQGQEEGTGSHGETGTKEEEDKVSKEPSGRVEPALGTVRDYTTLPELHGAPRGTLLMCLDNVSRCALMSRLVHAVICPQKVAVLGSDATIKMVKSETTVPKLL